jgi:hypothetical protein
MNAFIEFMSENTYIIISNMIYNHNRRKYTKKTFYLKFSIVIIKLKIMNKIINKIIPKIYFM